MFTPIQNQICAQIMKAYLGSTTSPKKQNPQKGMPSDTTQKTLTKTNIHPIILKQQNEPQSHESPSNVTQKQKASMEDLCQIFLRKIASREPGNFEAKELLDQSGIKRRRVYDLMNILEGCGYLKRISKATYYWKGFDVNFKDSHPSKKSKKDSVSLSELAAHLRHLLFSTDDKIKFDEIVRQISEQHQNDRSSQVSIKRRVYQCCKVLKVLGLIKKDSPQKAYCWVRELPDVASIIKQREESATKTKQKTQSSKKSLSEQLPEQMKSIIQSVLDNIGGEEELNTFISHLRGTFFSRLQRVNKQLKYD